jgi:hypothetical protein
MSALGMPVVSIRNARYDTKQLFVTTQCNYVFPVILAINSQSFHKKFTPEAESALFRAPRFGEV